MGHTPSGASGGSRVRSPDGSDGRVRVTSGGLAGVAQNALYLTTQARPRIASYSVGANGTVDTLNVCYRTTPGAYPTSPATDQELTRPAATSSGPAGAPVQLSGTTSGTDEADMYRTQPFSLSAGNHVFSWNLQRSITTANGPIACSTDLYLVPAGGNVTLGQLIFYTGASAPPTGSRTVQVATSGSYVVAASGGSGSSACAWSVSIS